MKKVIPFILIPSFLLSGCQHTPGTTIVNNGETESSSNVMIGEVDAENLPVISIRNEEVEEVIEAGDISVVIKGEVSKPDSYEEIYIYNAEVINYNQYESNMMFLFGEYEDQAVRVRDKFLMVYIEDGYKADLVNTSLVEVSGYTGRWGNIWYGKRPNPVTEDMRRVNMTFEEAKTRANEIMERIGANSFVFDECKYHEEVLQMTPEGTLSSPLGDSLTVYYSQKIQGVPIESTLIDLRIEPGARVSFDSEGVSAVSISEYQYDIYGKVEHCVTYDEAMELFKEYVSKKSSYDENIYIGVRFQYTIEDVYEGEKFVERAIPYWIFDRENDPLTTWDPRGDIYINCVDGSIYERN